MITTMTVMCLEECLEHADIQYTLAVLLIIIIICFDEDPEALFFKWLNVMVIFIDPIE